MRILLQSIAAACIVVVAGIPSAQTPTALAVEGRANANPSITSHGPFVAIAWSAATASAMDVYGAFSRDSGKTFSAPVRVNDVPGDARVNSELPPRVALIPGSTSRATPAIVVVWTTKAAAGTRILSARSTDGARSFGPSAPVPGSDAPGSRGWESVAVDARGRVLVLWLDHRETVNAPGGMMHHDSSKSAAAAPKTDPTERAALSKLYFASLDGGGATTITKSVCYCCKTSLVASGNDVYGAWRHVYAGSQRDIAFTMSRDGGRTFTAPVRVSDDGWHLDGCPENGPALALDAARRVHVVWPAPPDGKNGTPLGLFYATSNDGKTFTARAQLPTHGPAAHGQVIVDGDGSAIVAWDETINGARHIALARAHLNAKGASSFTPIASPDGADDRGWPVLAPVGKGALVAWVAGSGVGNAIRIARIK
jgi:hypothetical protein